MNVSIDDSTTSTYKLHTAILLYGEGPTSVAVSHDVVHEKQKGTRLGPGHFVTTPFVKGLLKLQQRGPLRFIPENVVALSHDAIAWFEPARKQVMRFHSASDKAVDAFDGATVPQPALVFIVRNQSLSVYALAKNQRPTLSTQLCKAPYWNTFDDHRVCTGSMVVPRSVEPNDTAAWTTAFFASYFTHSSGQKRWRHPGTYAEFLRAAIAAGKFDSKWLIPTNATLESAICGN
jgi:PRTRC genetic system protein B